MDTRVAAYAVIERRGEVLLTHWRRGHLHGWTLPGGGVEPGEDPKHTAKREVREETGLEANIGKLIGVDSRVFTREDAPEGTNPQLHTIRIIFRASVVEGELRHEVGGSSDEARWVPIREIPRLRTLALVKTGLRMAGIQVAHSSRKPRSRGRGRGPRPEHRDAQGTRDAQGNRAAQDEDSQHERDSRDHE